MRERADARYSWAQSGDPAWCNWQHATLWRWYSGFESLGRSSNRSRSVARDAVRPACEHEFVSKIDPASVLLRLRAGESRSAIARDLGVGQDAISRMAMRLGFAPGKGPRSRFDWAAIRTFYEAGHSRIECQRRFGFSLGSWDRAISRGDIEPRPAHETRPRGVTREAVSAMLEDDFSQAEIARRLELSKSTVAYHARSAGSEPDPRFRRRYDWKAIQKAYDEDLSVRQCAERFGFHPGSWHKAVQRGDIVPRPAAMEVEKLLMKGPKRGRNHLKRRMIAAGLKENQCEGCGITEWRGKRLNMELHHVNGDGSDNRLEDLQLLCANCHTQTDNWGRRGRGSTRAADA